tara:strand:+ start:619 stop:1668 length:1050 start_codon:yes stop_codon:yes gene_type:complete
MIDYIIVGYGIASLSFAFKLIKEKKDFIIIDIPETNSTFQSGAVLNPTILKRYTISWKGSEFLKFAKEFYVEFENEYNVKVFDEIMIHRYFSRKQEQNDWIVASGLRSLENYLDDNIIINDDNTFLLKNGYGIIKNTAKIYPKLLLDTFKLGLKTNNFIAKKFDYSKLKIFNQYVEYDNITSKKIVFCEGVGIKNNIFFNYLPIKSLKGEYLIINAPKLSSDFILKSSIYIIPLQKEVFWVGSTFDFNDKSQKKTKKVYNFLLSKLNSFISVPFEVIDHKIGFRPVVKDRRPILGRHPKYDNLILFNGLGTRGLMLAPLLSKWLYEYISEDKELYNEISINRYEELYKN